MASDVYHKAIAGIDEDGWKRLVRILITSRVFPIAFNAHQLDEAVKEGTQRWYEGDATWFMVGDAGHPEGPIIYMPLWGKPHSGMIMRVEEEVLLLHHVDAEYESFKPRLQLLVGLSNGSIKIEDVREIISVRQCGKSVINKALCAAAGFDPRDEG